MNLQVDNVARFFEEVANVLKRPDVAAAISKGWENNIQLEMEFAEAVNVCAPFSENYSRKLFDSIKSETVQSLKDMKFYDINTISAFACALDSLFMPSRTSIPQTTRLLHYLGNIDRVGDEDTAEGTAFSTDFQKVKKAFVIKAPNEKRIVDENSVNQSLLHEFVVGNVLNKLRGYIPNFAMIHGAIIGPGPVLENELIGVNKEEKVRYLVYENINGKTFDKFSRTCSFESWLNIYLQILYSLNIAKKMVNFGHYDLHSGNVMVRETELPAPMYIPYETENGLEYLSCGYVGTVIDYGFGTVRLDSGKQIGLWGLSKYGVYPKHPHSLSDAFRLLISCMSTFEYDNPDLFDYSLEIFEFFMPKSEYKDLETLYNYAYALPYDRTTAKDFSLFDLTKHIRSKFPQLSGKMFAKADVPNDRVLSCVENDLCLTRADATKELVHRGRVQTIVGFFDRITNPIIGDSTEKLKSEFEDKYQAEHDKNIARVRKILESIEVPQVQEYPAGDDPSVDEELFDPFEILLKSLNLYFYATDILDILQVVAYVYQNEENSKEVSDLTIFGNKKFDLLSEQVDVVEGNLAYFEQNPDDEDVDEDLTYLFERIMEIFKGHAL